MYVLERNDWENLVLEYRWKNRIQCVDWTNDWEKDEIRNRVVSVTFAAEIDLYEFSKIIDLSKRDFVTLLIEDILFDPAILPRHNRIHGKTFFLTNSLFRLIALRVTYTDSTGFSIRSKERLGGGAVKY